MCTMTSDSDAFVSGTWWQCDYGSTNDSNTGDIDSGLDRFGRVDANAKIVADRSVSYELCVLDRTRT